MTPLSDTASQQALLKGLAQAVATGDRDAERQLHAQLVDHFDDPGVMARTGQLYWHAGRVDQARELFAQACSRHNNDARTWATYAVFLCRQKQFEDALPAFVQALSIDPDNATARHRYGWALATIGQTDEAALQLQRAVALEPANAAAHYLLTTLTQYTPGHPHLQQLHDATQLPMAPRDKSRLLFALGRALEQTRRYDDSFAAYTEANAIRRAEFEFDITDERVYVDTVIDTFKSAHVARLRSAGFESTTPVFIVGLPRSGSTLLEHMLSCHPEVSGAGETTLFAETLEQHTGSTMLPGSQIMPLNETDAQAWYQAGKMYVENLRQVAGLRRRLIDKQLFNYYLIGAIAIALPQARFVHCVRAPLDACVSCFTTTFRTGRPWAYNMDEFVVAWQLHNRLMQHWQSLFPGRIHILRYEDLIDDPQAQLQAVLTHIDLPWSDLCLDFTASRRPVETASRGQVSRPVHSEAIGRWRPFASNLAEIIKLFEQSA